ncbi:MAG TPA: type II toxin-antitoxin system RelE/ParE family toxin [Planctomycetota bacterium]|nr:type II toxin-antitoxin system RelE/ParE family toxin [Planctomycetota bacterium]
MKFRHAFYKSQEFKDWATKLDAWEAVDELKILLDSNPDTGDVIPKGKGLRKTRIGLPGRGKRGGARVIYYQVVGECILLVDLYAKNEKSDLSDEELKDAIEVRDAMLNQIRGRTK